METAHTIRLTAAEVGALWSQYMNDSMLICVMKHFLGKVEEGEIQSIIEEGLHLSQKHVDRISSILEQEGHPIPIGFTEDDVDPNAPRLFSDSYMILYLNHMGIVAMAAGNVALGMATRSDAVDFFSGFFGERRPLHVVEVSHLFANIETNTMGKALLIGFSQVANAQEVKRYMLRCKQIAHKHSEVFTLILKEEDISVPMSWDSHVSGSTSSPFSDKLLMFHTTALVAIGIGNYALATSLSARRDLGIHYARLAQEIGLLAEDGANIMISNGWLEQPPLAPDRNALVSGKK